MEMLLYKTNGIHQLLSLIWIHSAAGSSRSRSFGSVAEPGNFQFTLFTIRKVSCRDLSFFVQIKDLQNLHCLLVHFFFNFKILRQSQDSGQSRILIMVMKTNLYIIQNEHILKQTDILEGTGNSSLLISIVLFSCNILSVQSDNSFCRLIACQKIKTVVFPAPLGPISP